MITELAGFTLARTIPDNVLVGVLSGSYKIFGGVVRNSSGQIIAHLVNNGSSLNMLSAFSSPINTAFSGLNTFQLYRIGSNVGELLNLAKELGVAICNPQKEDFAVKSKEYFGTAPSLNGQTANIDCWLDAAGAENILDDFMQLGKIESRFVSVAVNNKPRNIDLLYMTYAQQSIIGSGGYMPEDVRDVQNIMTCGKWNLKIIITHEFPVPELAQAIRTASDVVRAGNVVIRMADAKEY